MSSSYAAGGAQFMLDFVRAVKRELRDKYGCKPSETIGQPPYDEPIFDVGSIPDGDYPMVIDNKEILVNITDDQFNFDIKRPQPTKEPVVAQQDDNKCCTATQSFAHSIVPILQHPGGLGVEFEEQIGVYRQQDGTFSVFWKDSDDTHFEEYTHPLKAAERFVQLRDERKLGYDFDEDA